MLEAERSGRRARPGDLTRQRILTLARGLFARQGYEKTTMRQLAAKLAITDSALYYYFDHKRAILHELLADADDARLNPATATRDGVLAQLLETFYTFATQCDLVRIMLREQLCGGNECLHIRRTFNENYDAVYGPPLRELYGLQGALILEAVMLTLSGIIWDAVLTYGEDLDDVIQQEFFRDRVRSLLDLLLPTEPSK